LHPPYKFAYWDSLLIATRFCELDDPAICSRAEALDRSDIGRSRSMTIMPPNQTPEAIKEEVDALIKQAEELKGKLSFEPIALGGLYPKRP
jgi:hypothetical protein